MKFTLKDYQDEAVRQVLGRLRKARKDWREDGDRSAFSLSAATGAGKTVMAAAVFEALFHGDDERDVDPDPGAVVIWFSDDPSLNEQTRFRLMQAADRINLTDMVVVESTFQREKFQPGKIYFLNTQKLGRNSLLVRGHDAEGQFPQIRPDLRSFTIWDTIENTIEDPNLTLYLVLDEAHRGLGKSATADGERTTIVRRLINGTPKVPAMPVVWGISATVERFNRAMESHEGRTMLPNVVVDAAKVQDSGLLKDTILLDGRNEERQLDTVLVRRAAHKIREISEAWETYAREQGGEQVTPLMVLQVPNTPSATDVARWIDAIREAWPDLKDDAFANVFGQHRTETFGPYEVPYIAPQDVQERHWVRVLLAKDAISTGWDCPRAEVMVSFRAASDRTHIMQLLGRMVRTPLARRIPGNDRLNSVECLLPFFDREAVEQVADALMSGGTDGDGGIPGRRVLVNPVEAMPNDAVPEEVWEKFLSLPSQSKPMSVPKPVQRLTSLAHALAADGLLPNAGKIAHAKLNEVLDKLAADYAEQIAEARRKVSRVEGVTFRADLKNQEKSFDHFVEDADFVVIEDVYRRAARQYSPAVAKSYAGALADRLRSSDSLFDAEEALMEAHTAVAAMGLVPDIKTELDAAANRLAKNWFDTLHSQIKSLSDKRQEEYRQIKGMSDEPQDVDLAKPLSRWEATQIQDEHGNKRDIPTFANHLLCGPKGTYPAQLNKWEEAVLKKEIARPGFVAWYRNPSNATQDSLGVAYKEDKAVAVMRPDFLVFAKEIDGSITVDLIDPHGTHFADALPKLKGLAAYAEAHKGVYRRILAVAETNAGLRSLDLTDASVRNEIALATTARGLYEGTCSKNY